MFDGPGVVRLQGSKAYCHLKASSLATFCGVHQEMANLCLWPIGYCQRLAPCELGSPTVRFCLLKNDQ